MRVAYRLVWQVAPDFNLEQVGVLKPFYQNPVNAVVQLGNQLVHGQFNRLLKLAHQGQPLVRGHHHFKGTRFAVAKGVFAGVVYVKTMVGVLDDRHPLAVAAQDRNEAFHQGGFARSGIARKAYNFHAQC